MAYSELAAALEIACDLGNTIIVECLLAHGAAPLPSCLVTSAARGHAQLLDRLVFYGADVNDQDEKSGGYTALISASHHGQLESVYKLLEMGADVARVDATRRSALMVACGAHQLSACRVLEGEMCAHQKVVRVLVSTTDVDLDQQDTSGNTPLMLAVTTWDHTLVVALLKAGAKVDVEDEDGVTALMKACARGQEETVQVLLEHGACVNRRDRYGETSLIKACLAGHTACAKLMLQQGTPLNLADNNGCTAVMWAVQHRHLEMVHYLDDLGGDLLSINRAGMTCLAFAAENGDIKLVEHLLARGMCGVVDEVDVSRRSAVMKACEGGHENVVRCLVEGGGARLDLEDREHRTALMICEDLGHAQIRHYLAGRGAGYSHLYQFLGACASGDTDTVRQLLAQHLFPVDATLQSSGPDMSRRSGLMVAAREDQWPVVSALLQEGADVNLSTSTTALHLASRAGHATMAGYLLIHGAHADVVDAEGDTPLLAAVREQRLHTLILLLSQVPRLQCLAARSLANTATTTAGHIPPALEVCVRKHGPHRQLKEKK